MSMMVLNQRLELRGGLPELILGICPSTCPSKAREYHVSGQYLGSQGYSQLQHHTKTMVESKAGIVGKGERDTELCGMVHPGLHIAIEWDKQNLGSILSEKCHIHRKIKISLP